MAQTLKNNYTFFLDDDLQVSGTTVAITNDQETNSVVTIADPADVTLIAEDGSQIERMSITCATGTMTCVTRGIKNDSTGTADAALKKKWLAGQKVILTIFASKIVTAAGNNTWTGNNTHTGTETFTGPVSITAAAELNVAGQSNVYPVVADATARDALYPSPVTGDGCYRNDLHAVQKYDSVLATWQTEGTGTPTPNASTTNGGIVKIGTVLTDPDQVAGLYNQTPNSAIKNYVDTSIAAIPAPTAEKANLGILAGEALEQGNYVFSESAITYANATSKQNIGDVAGNTRVGIRQIGSGVASDTLKLALSVASSPSVDLGIRIESAADYTVPAITAINGSYVASGATDSWKGFDGDPATACGYGATSGVLQVQLPSAVKIWKYSILLVGTYGQPAAWTFDGSNNGSSWTTLDTQTGITTKGLCEYTCTSATAYSYYRLAFSSTSDGNFGVIYDMQIFRLSDDGVYSETNMLPKFTADTTAGDSRDAQASYVSQKPSGTLIDANATATIAPGSLTGSLADTTVTLAGSITIPAGTPYFVVLFQGTYGSETVNGSNYYNVGYGVVNTTTRGTYYYGGATRGLLYSKVYCYVSSTLSTTTLLSKTNANYTYKMEALGASAAAYATGTTPLIEVGGVSSSITGMTANVNQFLDGKQGAIKSSTPFLCMVRIVGKSITTGLLDINKFVTQRISSAGVYYLSGKAYMFALSALTGGSSNVIIYSDATTAPTTVVGIAGWNNNGGTGSTAFVPIVSGNYATGGNYLMFI